MILTEFHSSAVLDANVLFSFRKRDILVSFYLYGLFQAYWTEDIFDELLRNIRIKKPHLEHKVSLFIARMRQNYDDAFVINHESQISSLHLKDKNDRHVLAAGIVTSSDYIVTDDIDFLNEDLSSYGIHSISADDFLCEIFFDFPIGSLESLRNLRNSYNNPPFSKSEFIQDLFEKGLPKLAELIKPHKELL